MAYEPTLWKNREVERPRTFTIVDNPDGTKTLIPAEGNVAEQGTPIMAVNMNKIENQLVYLDGEVANIYPSSDGPIAKSLEGMGITNLNDVTEVGLYSHNTPTMLNRAPGIMGQLNGTYLGDTIEVTNTLQGTITQTTTRVGNLVSRAVTRQSRGFSNGVWGPWYVEVTNVIDGSEVWQAASVTLVKSVNDKFTSEGLITTPVLSGWTANYPIKYYKDAFGVVHVIGWISSGANTSIRAPGTKLFTLPVGYRPVNLGNFSLSTRTTLTDSKTVDAYFFNGTLELDGTSLAVLLIDISFRTY